MSESEHSMQQASDPVDIFSSHALKFQLPVYIKNMFLACGYDNLEIIAEMDVCQTTVPNDIDKIIDYVNQTFPQDSR